MRRGSVPRTLKEEGLQRGLLDRSCDLQSGDRAITWWLCREGAGWMTTWPPPFPLSDFLSALLGSLHWRVQEACWWSSRCWFWSISNSVYPNGGSPENQTGGHVADGGVYPDGPPGYTVKECMVHVGVLTEEPQEQSAGTSICKSRHEPIGCYHIWLALRHNLRGG